MTYTPAEMMTVAAARALGGGDICFVGIGLPSAACNLARLTHAPRIQLIYESGTLGTRPDVLPLSIGDGELCETALTIRLAFRVVDGDGAPTPGDAMEGAANRPLLVLVHALDWRGCGSERRVRRVTTAAAAYVLGYAAS
jgi:hypothetical protein